MKTKIPKHEAVGAGRCKVCGHYGEDCTGKKWERPAINWDKGLEPIGNPDPLTRLLGVMEIGGASFHVEAWEVRETKKGEQFCKDGDAADWYDYITGNMTEGAGQTVEINGRNYFIVVTPFQN